MSITNSSVINQLLFGQLINIKSNIDLFKNSETHKTVGEEDYMSSIWCCVLLENQLIKWNESVYNYVQCAVFIGPFNPINPIAWGEASHGTPRKMPLRIGMGLKCMLIAKFFKKN